MACWLRLTLAALPPCRNLAGQGLKGALGPALSGMGALAALDLGANALSGSLPATWAFPSLSNMSLAANKLGGPLPTSWPAAMPALQQLQLAGNSLQGTMPGGWVDGKGFKPPFTAVLQPGNAGLCGPVAPAPGYTLQYGVGSDSHTIVTTLGSCAQGSCGSRSTNTSAPNLYDVSWANAAAPLDVAAFNANVGLNRVPISGTQLVLPCYPPGAAPGFFGGNVAFGKATWQSSTDGSQTSNLAVSGQGTPNSTAACSVTTDTPGWWMVDLQQSAVVQVCSGGLLCAGGA